MLNCIISFNYIIMVFNVWGSKVTITFRSHGKKRKNKQHSLILYLGFKKGVHCDLSLTLDI